ncbi:MAG: response regulator [Pseudomonadota bacterium]
MPETIDKILIGQKPTRERPLLGQTVLVIEDSRFASEALRLMCLRSGARIRRADSVASATRHLSTYHPSVAIVDLGLPDGSGLSLIEAMASAQPRVPVILATSGDDGAVDAARDAGADGYLPKPMTSLAAFQAAILAHLPAKFGMVPLRAVDDPDLAPDMLAFRDDLTRAAEVAKAGTDHKTLGYLAQFLQGLAKTAGDDPLEQAAAELGEALKAGTKAGPSLNRLAGLIKSRLRAPVSV